MSIERLVEVFKQLTVCPRLRLKAVQEFNTEGGSGRYDVYQLDYFTEYEINLLMGFIILSGAYPEFITVQQNLPISDDFPKRIMFIDLMLPKPPTPPAAYSAG